MFEQRHVAFLTATILEWKHLQPDKYKLLIVEHRPAAQVRPEKNHPQVLEKFCVGAKDRKYQIWERNPLSVYCYTSAVLAQKLHYIHHNPVQEK
jgi:hypothetical protein